MKFALILGFLLPIFVISCGPGTGPTSTSAKFVFDFIPPIVYTWSENPNKGQADAGFAVYLATNDINEAIDQVLANDNLPINDISKIDVDFIPTNAPLTDDCLTTGSENSYQTVGNLVFYKCAPNARLPFHTNQTVTVYSSQLIYQSQWEQLAQNVQEKLELKRGTQFFPNSPVVTQQ